MRHEKPANDHWVAALHELFASRIQSKLPKNEFTFVNNLANGIEIRSVLDVAAIPSFFDALAAARAQVTYSELEDLQRGVEWRIQSPDTEKAYVSPTIKKGCFNPSHVIEKLRQFSPDMITREMSKWLQDTFIETFVYGNVDADLAHTISDLVEASLEPRGSLVPFSIHYVPPAGTVSYSSLFFLHRLK